MVTETYVAAWSPARDRGSGWSRHLRPRQPEHKPKMGNSRPEVKRVRPEPREEQI